MINNRTSFNIPRKSSEVLKEHMINVLPSSASTHVSSKPNLYQRKFTSYLNTNGRLQNLKVQIEKAEEKLLDLVTVTKDLKQDLLFFRQESLTKSLPQLEFTLRTRVKEFKKKITISQRADYLKYSVLHETLKEHGKSNRELRERVSEMDQRIRWLESAMGMSENVLRSKLQ